MDRALISLGGEIAVTVTKAQPLTAEAGVIGFQTGLPVLKDLGLSISAPALSLTI